MGCCNSKKDKIKNVSNGIEEINIESQERELINILTEVNKKIDNLKNEVIVIILLIIYYIGINKWNLFWKYWKRKSIIKFKKKMLLFISITNICEMGDKSAKC